MFISNADLASFIAENYITYLILGGLVIVMIAYRGVRLPAVRNYQLIVLVLFLMSLAFSFERWATLSPDRINIRIAASVIHYILQPLVIWLELIVIMPESERSGQSGRFLLALPVIINTVIYLAAPFAGHLVFWYGENYWFHRGPLGYSIYIVTFFYLALLILWTVSIYIVTFFYLALLILWTVRFFRSDEKRKSIILFFMTGIAVLTGVLEGLNIVPGYIDEAFALGIFLYFMYVVTMHESEMQASLARKELELSQSKVTLLRQQIRPHFVFNSLQIIKSLIRSDQEKAVRSLEDFSDYLRANIDVIESDSLISFEEELAHTRAYVDLALADESKDINVEYDIQERYFRIPPLTVEPMVENAIRHGLANGGTVRVSSRSEADDIVIVISDDGTGFTDQGTDKKKARTGAGIENVRARLASMCNGSLGINSDSNGTTVQIRIPKNANESSGKQA